MRTGYATTFAVACLATVLVSGCGTGTAEPEADVETPPTAETSPAVAPEEPAKQKPVSQTVRRKQPAYQAPFPSRTELFYPPAGSRRVARRSNGKYEESVELMGFAGLDELHAVLAIDGVVTPVALGDEQHGVQVISIDPPLAVLQRGRTRWTATLE